MLIQIPNIDLARRNLNRLDWFNCPLKKIRYFLSIYEALGCLLTKLFMCKKNYLILKTTLQSSAIVLPYLEGEIKYFKRFLNAFRVPKPEFEPSGVWVWCHILKSTKLVNKLPNLNKPCFNSSPNVWPIAFLFMSGTLPVAMRKTFRG